MENVYNNAKDTDVEKEEADIAEGEIIGKAAN